MDINKIISIVRESRLNEMMTTGSTAGAPGFSSKADAEGPVAGLDAPMGCGEKKKKKKVIGLGKGSRKRWRIG